MIVVIDLLIKLLLSYLIGSVVGSLLIGKLKGIDIRTAGSGNAGATNALRTQGAAFAVGTMIIDVAKGVIAAGVIANLSFTTPTMTNLETQLFCAFAAAVGHCYPVFHGFRGGKGAGTLIGGIAVVFPWVALAMFGVWALLLMGFGYVGLATVVAGLSFPVFVFFLIDGSAALVALAISIAMFLAYTHRSNLERLIQGSENRFERARIIGRLFSR